MLNVTKLSCWPDLERMGFEPVKYYGHGKLFGIGATLYHTFSSGNKGETDIITISPSGPYRDEINYHISGHFANDGEHCNNHFKATDILEIVQKLKTELHK